MTTLLSMMMMCHSKTKIEERKGYKMSYVLRHGIKVAPIPVAQRGGIAYWFYLKITKISRKTGKEIEVRQRNRRKYPVNEQKEKTYDKDNKPVTKTIPSVWDKIDEIYEYYYNKLRTDEKSLSTE